MFLETHMLQLSLPRPCHHHTRPHHHPPLHIPSELQVTNVFFFEDFIKHVGDEELFLCKTWLSQVDCK